MKNTKTCKYSDKHSKYVTLILKIDFMIYKYSRIRYKNKIVKMKRHSLIKYDFITSK